MRICYLCADRGIQLGGRKGASAHARGLLHAFLKAGHDVVAVSAAPDDGVDLGVRVVRARPPLVAEDFAVGSPDRRLGRALQHLWNNVSVERTLGEVIGEQQSELVYERYGPFGVAGGIVARRLGIPHLLEVNAPLAREGAQYRGQALPEACTALEKSALSTAGRVLAVSDELREELVEGGAPPERISVVPNGVDATLFAGEGPSRRGELAGSFVVGFVGGLRPWHAIDSLVEAFRKLASDPRYHLLVVGDGPLAGLIESLERELPGRVTAVRGVAHAEVPGYVRAMDVAVAPYPPLDRFYYSPLKVLEYMAAGRAVVASDIGQLRTLVRPDETGLLVPPGDASALAEAVRRLADDTALRLALGARAADEVQHRHTWDMRARQILALTPRTGGPEPGRELQP